jgi:glucosyl-3-phosphoglycerate phosphatase
MVQDVYLIRHGQSTFNAAFAANGVDPMHFDARVSEKGAGQIVRARQAALDLGVDLVVASPLTRALQTAIGLFDGAPVPIMVSSIHVERLEHSCDVGRAPAELSDEFPSLDFDHLADSWWHLGENGEGDFTVEPEPVLMDRVAAFSQWIAARPEPAVAVVGHGEFFQRLTGRYMENCEITHWMR